MSSRGGRLLQAMRERGLRKQHALAHTIGVNESTVTRWLRDGPMSLDHAVALCAALEVSLDWLVLGREPIAALLESGEQQRIRVAVSLLSARAQSLLTDLIEELTASSGGQE